MKIALYGLWHVHAPGYYKTAAQYGEVIGVYEPNDAFRISFCEEYGVPAFTSAEELLNSDADAVIVCTSTDIHADVIVSIANAGKDIFTEKVLALTSEECLRIADAVKQNKVRFVISYPWKFRAEIRTVKAIADNGELGKLNYFRFRNCHNGSTGDWLPKHFFDRKECGGGAMIDLGAHGMYLADWFLGEPDTYSSTFTLASVNNKNTDNVEDNAITVMGYKNGAIAVNETGFVSVGCPTVLEIGGEKGYVTCQNRGTVIKTTTATDLKPVEVELLPELPTPLDAFLQGESPEGCGIEDAIRLTRMMEGAYANVR